MVRSAARTPALAIFGALGLSTLHRLQSISFVSPTLSRVATGGRSQSLLIRAATQAEIAEAEKHAKLVTWAAKKAAEEGMPQATMMQAKADQAVQALEALKQQESGAAPAPIPVAPAAVATTQSTVSSPMMTVPSSVMTEEVTELETRVRLLTWAAKKAAEEGMPQAPAAQVRADQAAQQLAQLKAQLEAQQTGRPATPVSVPSAPAVQVAPVAQGAAPAVSKAELAEAEKHAKLVTWAAKKAAEEGMPQAGMMQAKADQAVQALAAMKDALEQQEMSKPAAVPVPSAPVAAASAAVAAAPAVPTAPVSAPSQAELEQVKKEMKLLVWAAKTTAEQGMPQADMMRLKADAKVQEYEQMMQAMQLQPAR